MAAVSDVVCADGASALIPPLWPTAPTLAAEAAKLAAQFGLSLRPPAAEEIWALALTPDRLELRHRRAVGRTQVLAVDFAAEALTYRRQQPGFGEALAKAVGVDAKHKPQLIDATAGWGRDAFLLAHWGCHVTMLEQHPAVAALLADGLRRAAQVSALAPQMARLHLIYGEARDYLAQTETLWDAIYLDPMFPPRRGTALVKGELQALQALVGAQEADALWAAARLRARRIIVKRPAWAAALAATPNFSVGRGAVRFDVFLGVV